MCSGPQVNVGLKRHIEETSVSILGENNTDELIRLKKMFRDRKKG